MSIENPGPYAGMPPLGGKPARYPHEGPPVHRGEQQGGPVEPTPHTTKGDILRTAATLTEGQRSEEYGGVVPNFEAVAAFWTAHLSAKHRTEIQVDAEDVAWMMIDVKRARTFAPIAKEDNYVDAAAYAAIAGELRLRTKKE